VSADDPLLSRLNDALDAVEAAAERRLHRDLMRGDADAELATMQDDRARLAVELDAALEARRALAQANAAALERVARAAGVVERFLDSGKG